MQLFLHICDLFLELGNLGSVWLGGSIVKLFCYGFQFSNALLHSLRNCFLCSNLGLHGPYFLLVGSGSRCPLGGCRFLVGFVFLLGHPVHKIFDNLFQVQDPGLLVFIYYFLIHDVCL